MACAAALIPEMFGKHVKLNRLQLPTFVQVVESADDEVLEGDIMKLESVWDKYETEYEDSVTHRTIHVDVPCHLGGFKTISEHPPNYVYGSVYEMVLDFPTSVRVLDAFQVHEYLVKKGEGLKLSKIKRVGDQQYLVCQHFPSEKTLKLPFDLKGQFQKRNDNTVYTVEQLKNRMPVRVKRDIDMVATLQRSQTALFSGIPEDGVLVLTKSTMVQVEHWKQPSSADIYTGRGKTDKLLQINRNFSVIAVDYLEGQFGPLQHVADIATDTAAIVCSEHPGYDSSGIGRGTMVEVKGIRKEQGVILRGTSAYLLVPKNHNTNTKFRMRGKEYPTPRDLWKANYKGEVLVTQTAKSPTGFKQKVRSIYQHDRVELVRGPDDLEMPKFLSDNDTDECEVVDLCRNFSQVKACLGNISVEADANVCFEEPPNVVGQHCLADILHYGEIPMGIGLCYVSRYEEISEGDQMLVCQSPFTVIKECEYTVSYVKTFDTGDNVFEVPDFRNMQVRPAKKTKRKPTEFEKPMSSVFQLSSEEYVQLVGDPFDEPVYNDIEDNVQTLSLSFNSKLSHLVPIHSPAVTPPQSPLHSRAPPSLLTPSFGQRDVKPSYGILRDLEQGDILSTSLQPCVTRTMLPLPEQSHDIQTKPPKTLPKRKTSANEEGKRVMQAVEKDKPVQLSKEANTIYDRPIPKPRRLTKPPAKVPSEQQTSTSSKADKIPPPIARRSIKAPNICTVAPAVAPPANKVITSYNALQLAGMMRYLGFGENAITSCVEKNINAQELIDIFRNAASDEDLRKHLKLDNLSEVHCLRLFVNQTELAEALPDVTPPEDGYIKHFSVRELAGLMKFLGGNEKTISICLAQQIDGQKLCRMDDEMIKSDLGLAVGQFYALKHFISISNRNADIFH